MIFKKIFHIYQYFNTNLNHISCTSSGGDNSSDTESAPSPFQADSSKSADSRRLESTAGDSQCSDHDRSQAGNGKALELSHNELRVKEEKSPQDETQSQEAKVASFSGSIHPKTEPQDMDMKAGEVQVKMEPEVKERGEKAEHGGREHHSDNDSSATCSADEDVEAEPERRCAFITVVFKCLVVYRWMMYVTYVLNKFLLVLQNIGGEAFFAQPSRLSVGIPAQTSPTQHPAIAATSSSNPTNG